VHKRNGLHVALGLTAIAGWLLFILGCTGWSSWSPDGSKILFTYIMEQDGQKALSVALFDRNTSEARTLFSCPDDDSPCIGQWRQDGASALVFAKEEGRSGFSVFDVPTAAGGVIKRIATIENSDGLIPPIPEVNGFLYLNGNPTTRLDLNTGAVQVFPETDQPVLYNWTSGRMLYGISHACDDSDKSHCRIEIGEMTAGGDSRNQLFEIAMSDPALHNPKDIALMISTDPERERFALVTEHQEHDQILLYDRGGLQRVLKPKFPAGQFRLGNLQWARDGQSIYASVMHPLDNGDTQWSMAQISLRSGSVHLVPLTTIRGHIDLGEFYLVCQISLSPDGQTLAASSGLCEADKISSADRGLFLIDVDSHDGQRITKIPISSFVPTATQ